LVFVYVVSSFIAGYVDTFVATPVLAAGVVCSLTARLSVAFLLVLYTVWLRVL